MRLTSQAVLTLPGSIPTGPRKRVLRSPMRRAFSFIACTSAVECSPTARPRAETARLSEAINAACSRSRLL